MKEIRAVVLDADGVVILPWRFARYLDEEHGVTRDDTREFFTGVFLDCLVGEADLREVLPPYLEEWRWPGTVETFTQTWFETENAPDERVLEVVQSLRQSGILCCLATNQEKHRAQYMTTIMGMANCFDHLFFSHQIGHLKEDPAFFASVTSFLGLEKEQFLFWDDSAKNVKTAHEYGWHAEVYRDFESFKTGLERYLP